MSALMHLLSRYAIFLLIVVLLILVLIIWIRQRSDK
jgi:hypothetical protein